MKGIDDTGQDPNKGGFASWGEVSNLTFPALARESGPFHGPSPLASFGNEKIPLGAFIPLPVAPIVPVGTMVDGKPNFFPAAFVGGVEPTGIRTDTGPPIVKYI